MRHHLLWVLLEAEEIAQVDLRVGVTRDLTLVEEAREVGFHFDPARHPHAQLEQTAQVVLHQGPIVLLQTLVPELLVPLTSLLAEEKQDLLNVTQLSLIPFILKNSTLPAFISPSE